ncbi:glycoside hydrolase superfamily [Entophlyctis helioformis]|nr:glycoside hydrolase superfamily [Entophlyctis helioformis]
MRRMLAAALAAVLWCGAQAQLVVLGDDELGFSPLRDPSPVTEYVTTEPRVADILSSHATVHRPEQRVFDTGAVLGYVTPWNNHGYDVAKGLSGKFTHIAPVWYHNTRGASKMFLEGSHDVDQGWIANVRKPGVNGHAPLVVPLFQISEFGRADWEALISTRAGAAELEEIIAGEVMKHGFDGMVLEMLIPGRFAGNIVRTIGSRLRDMGKQFIFVIPPRHAYMAGDVFDSNDFENLEGYVDFFSLMTYDHTLSTAAGPNAPLPWIQSNVQRLCGDEGDRSKVLIGLAMYGYDFDHSTNVAEPLTGSKYLAILAESKPLLEWDNVSAEHRLSMLMTEAANTRSTIHLSRSV